MGKKAGSFFFQKERRKRGTQNKTSIVNYVCLFAFLFFHKTTYSSSTALLPLKITLYSQPIHETLTKFPHDEIHCSTDPSVTFSVSVRAPFFVSQQWGETKKNLCKKCSSSTIFFLVSEEPQHSYLLMRVYSPFQKSRN